MQSSHSPNLSAFEPVPSALESRLWEGGLPYFLKSDKPASSIAICLHGYAATPFETTPAARAFVKAGLDAAAPLFMGHNYKHIEDQKRYFPGLEIEAMLGAVRREIEEARQHYENVFLYGQSMGAAVALVLAAEGGVDAIALTAPAIKLPRGVGVGSQLLGWANLFVRLPPTKTEKKAGNLRYPFVNTRSLRALHELGLLARRNLHRIQCPVFNVQSRRDRAINPIVANWIEKGVNGPVEVAWFDDSDHTMLFNECGREITSTIAAFFIRQEGTTS